MSGNAIGRGIMGSLGAAVAEVTAGSKALRGRPTA